MTDAGYIFLACLFVALAIVVRLLWRHDAAWIAKDLHGGDLRAFAQVANGKHYGVGRDRLLRLSRRGFVSEDPWGGCRMTLKGRYAALLLRTRAASAREAAPIDRSRR